MWGGGVKLRHTTDENFRDFTVTGGGGGGVEVGRCSELGICAY